MSSDIQPYAKQENKIIKAESGTYIREAATKDISNMIIKVCIVAGVPSNSIPQDDATFPHASYLHKLIREMLGNWKIQEVEYAFELAARKMLAGDDGKAVDLKLYDRMLNPEYFGNVMEAYRRYKLINKPKMPEIQIPKPTEEEIKEIMRNNFIALFDNYRKTNIFVDFGNANYQYAKDKCIISFTQSEYERIVMKAEQIYRSACENKIASSRNIHERNRFRDILKSAVDINKNELQTIIMNLQLRYTFDKWIENKLHPSQLI